MQGTVELHAIIRIRLEVEGDGEEGLIAAAILKAQDNNPALAEDPSFLRYYVTVRRPGEPPTVTLYHDLDELDRLHEERTTEDAQIFDLDEVFPSGAMGDTEIARGVPYHAAN